MLVQVSLRIVHSVITLIKLDLTARNYVDVSLSRQISYYNDIIQRKWENCSVMIKESYQSSLEKYHAYIITIIVFPVNC